MQLTDQVNLELSRRLKEIDGYEGLYVVTENGKIFSIARKKVFGKRVVISLDERKKTL